MAWRDVRTKNDLKDGVRVRVRWPHWNALLEGKTEPTWKEGLVVVSAGGLDDDGRWRQRSARIEFPDGGFLPLPQPLGALQVDV